MTRWTYKWRPSELDFLIEGPEGEPCIVVRPSLVRGCSIEHYDAAKVKAERKAELFVWLLNAGVQPLDAGDMP